mmetsp:Transcript_47340/g.146048  ORF Transcript_47340/g.146048 Transcript_47340/m.146048 type:complete len:201 (+) Transcript_47340:846-1448(+)
MARARRHRLRRRRGVQRNRPQQRVAGGERNIRRRRPGSPLDVAGRQAGDATGSAARRRSVGRARAGRCRRRGPPRRPQPGSGQPRFKRRPIRGGQGPRVLRSGGAAARGRRGNHGGRPTRYRFADHAEPRGGGVAATAHRYMIRPPHRRSNLTPVPSTSGITNDIRVISLQRKQDTPHPCMTRRHGDTRTDNMWAPWSRM